jgi:tetratricopeptide (TPR) repeat protein
MRIHTHLALISFLLFAPPLFGQRNTTSIPEEARKHFVMGTTLFKDAKTTADFSRATREFNQATELAPQWPDARYNLALAKEAAGDYSGAMADLKLYQRFKLSEDEARKVQDKIYVLEAKGTEAKEKNAAANAAKTQAAAGAEKKAFIRSILGVWKKNTGKWDSPISQISINSSDYENIAITAPDSTITHVSLTGITLHFTLTSYYREARLADGTIRYRADDYNISLKRNGHLEGLVTVHFSNGDIGTDHCILNVNTSYKN